MRPSRWNPRLLAFYAWIARRTLAGDPVRRPGNRDVDDRAHAREFLDEYRKAGGEKEVETTLRNGMTSEFFDQRASRLREALEQHLDTAAALYGLKRAGVRGRSHTCCGPPCWRRSGSWRGGGPSEAE